MKTIANNTETSMFETVKRFIYSFQVLIIGVAIPVLFIIGISNINQKKSREDITNQVSNTTQLSTRVVGFPLVKI